MNELRLLECIHPDENAKAVFDDLFGIDEHKTHLLDELVALLDPGRLADWVKRCHPKGIAMAKRWTKGTPVVLLSGDVGCGKSALAGSIGTPLARELDKRIVSLETPSDLRGWGHVGEMSARITEAFDQARRRARDVGAGLLVVDEADDVATARAQMQAHHEDRAGLNVLIKQIDQLRRSGDPLAVLLITNRHDVLDPAVRRRTAAQLHFARPDAVARRAVFRHLLDGLRSTDGELNQLTAASERSVPYSYSDLMDRLPRVVLREAQRRDVAVTVGLVLECLETVAPSPSIEVSA